MDPLNERLVVCVSYRKRVSLIDDVSCLCLALRKDIAHRHGRDNSRLLRDTFPFSLFPFSLQFLSGQREEQIKGKPATRDFH